MNVSAHIVISGMVQGVGFRYYAYSNAVSLGLKGFVRNIPNGNVELKVEGERSLIEEMIKELRVGPRAARVSDVHVTWGTGTPSFKTFEIR